MKHKITTTLILIVALTYSYVQARHNYLPQGDNPNTITYYLQLKDALVQSNSELAKSAGNKLIETLKSENRSGSLIKSAQTISSSEDLDTQRKAFKSLTDELISELNKNSPGQSLYVQFCPMAFGNTGASWISDSDQIRNPYFGDAMLKCGFVKDEIE